MRPKLSHPRVSITLLFMVLLTACGPSTAGATRAWIDVPLDGARIAPGSNVAVHAHANDLTGVAEVMLLVNGSAYRRSPPASPGAVFTDVELVWIADTPGHYILQVEAFNRAGGSIKSAPVLVLVEGISLTPTTTTETASVTPPPPVTSAPPPAVVFVADSENLTAGQCTNLRWQVGNASAASLDGTSVDLVGARQVCPQATTTYRMSASGPGGKVEKTVTLTVTHITITATVPDTNGPSITNVAHSPAFIWDGSSCGTTTANITAKVNDPSGVASVTLFYRAVKGGTQGAWREVGMNLSGGSYRASLGITELKASLPLYGDGIVEYYIKARDTLGNTVKSSPVQQFEARLCFG